MRPKIYLKTDSVWDYMKNCGMSAQAHLAEKIGVSDSSISEAMKGGSISRKMAEAIASALKSKFDDVAFEDRSHRHVIPRTPITENPKNQDLQSAVKMLTKIHEEDPQAWEWITGNLVMFTRALSRGGLRRKARDAG